MLINNSNFLIKEVPNFHPLSQRYERLEFWRNRKREAIEGYWSGGKWCPPELFYYINFHNIMRELGTNRVLGLPDLRDIDWEMGYYWTEASGFSGFELDDKYTCHRFYGPDKANALKFGFISEEETAKKKYIDAREYLRKNHGTNLGKPLYANEAKNFFVLGSRGFGKSYFSSALILHNFLFDGARDYDSYLARRKSDKPLQSECGVGAIDAKYSNDLIEKVKVAIEYLPGKASIDNAGDIEYYPSPFMVDYTGSVMPGRNWLSTVSKSTIHHRTFQDNALVMNGLRPNRIFIDEVGFMNNLLEAWGAIEATQAAAEFKRLVICGMGTGGLTTGGAALYAQEIFYNPEQYNCVAIEDIWENKGKIGYFVSGVHALNKFKEGPDRITNEEKALESIISEREEAKKASSRTKLLATIINKPIKPSEIFLRLGDNLFPTADLNSRLATLETDRTILNSTYKVQFSLVDGKPKMGVSDKLPIREFPLRKGMSMDACIEMFEPPKRDHEGKTPWGRYIAGWDPVETDGNEDIYQSLQSVFVLDTWTDRIVAEYTARTYLHEEYYEQVRRLLINYNAVCNYENKIKGPYGYFKNKNSLHLLAETPEILKDNNLVKGGNAGNKALGTATNDHVTGYGLGLILSWLEKQAYDKEEGIRNVDLLESPGLIKELVSYSGDINVDRIMALIMVMILREERQRVTELTLNKRTEIRGSDKFFDRPFKKKSTTQLGWEIK
jgi:hypothetical protein